MRGGSSQRRSLPTDEGVSLLRRSHSLGNEIMDQTKTGLDQEIPGEEEKGVSKRRTGT